MSTSSASIDAELVLLSLRGNREAFAALFDRHAPRVYAVAHGLVGERTDAEDITQETFVQALSALPTLRQPEFFGAWVARIATNAGLNVLRRRGRLPRVELDAVVGDSYPDTARWTSPEAMGLAADDQHAVRTTLNRLAPSHRTALTLREVGGLSYAEIAQALGVTPGGVETLLFRARARFRDEYAKVALGAANKTTTTCRQAQGALAALADGELAKSRRDVVVAHVRTCNACATTLQEQREAHRLLVAMPMVIPTSLKLATLTKVGPLLAGHAAAAGATVAGVAGGAAVAGVAGGTTAGSAAAGTTAAGAAAGSAAAGAALTGSAAASGAAVASAGAVSATVAGTATAGSLAAGAASLVSGATTGASALMGSITAGATSLAGSVAAGASSLLTPAVVGAGATGAVAKATAVLVTGALVTGILATTPPKPSVSRHNASPATTALPGQGQFELPTALPQLPPAHAIAPPLRQPAGHQRGAARRPVPRSHGSVGETAHRILRRAPPHAARWGSPILTGSVANGVPFATVTIPAQAGVVGAHGQRLSSSATPVAVPGAPKSPGTAVAAPPIPRLSPTVQPVAAATEAPAGRQVSGSDTAPLTAHAPSGGGTILAVATSVSTPTAAPPTVAATILSVAAAAPIPATAPAASPSPNAHAPGVGSTQPAPTPTPTPAQVVALTSRGASGSVHPTPTAGAGGNIPTPAPMDDESANDGPQSPPMLGQAASGGTPTVQPPAVSSDVTSTVVISGAIVGDSAAPTAAAGGLSALPTTGLAGLSDPGAVATSLAAMPTGAPSGDGTGLQSPATPTVIPSDTPTDATTPTRTPTDVPSDMPTDTAIPSETPTDTAVPTDSPTDTTTSTPTLTATVVPTDTPTDTATSSNSTPSHPASMPLGGTCVTPPDTPPSADLGGASGDPQGDLPTATAPAAGSGDGARSAAGTAEQPKATTAGSSGDTVSGPTTTPPACLPTDTQPAAGPTDQSGIVGGAPAVGSATAQAIDPGGSGDVPATAIADSPGAANDMTPTATATDSADARPSTAASITVAGAGDGSAQEIVSGAGFVPGETVTLSWNGVLAGGVTIAPDGTFTLTVDAPPAGTGIVVLLAQGDSGDQAAATASF